VLLLNCDLPQKMHLINTANAVMFGTVKGYPTYKEKVKTRPGGKHEGM